MAVEYKYLLSPGINEDVVKMISEYKQEPEWMTNIRLNAFKEFIKKPTPDWGYPYLSKELDFTKFIYFADPMANKTSSWEELPEDIKKAYEELNLPEIERKYLAGIVSTFDSSPVVSKIKRELEEKGIIFMDLDSAVQKYPDLVRDYFMKAVPISDNKFAALHAAVWSGGTFLYVPPHTKVDWPLQSYFKIHSASIGQFEHTIIIADKGSEFTYIEGCSAPTYSGDQRALHAGVVEIYVEDEAKVNFISIENWSKNVYNLTTKRAIIKSNANMQWIEATLGSKVSMIYPASYIRGDNSSTTNINLSVSPPNTWKDTGSKVIISGNNARARLLSKSISIGNGVSVYRSLINVSPSANNAKIFSECDSLLVDKYSRAYTFPHNEIRNQSAEIHHEAYSGAISRENIEYLRSRGISENDAKSFLAVGFIDDILRAIPVEFSVEISKLIKMQMNNG